MLGLLVAMLMLLWGCTSQKDNSAKGSGQSDTIEATHIYQNLAPYKGWQKFRQGDIIIIHSPEQPRMDRLPEFARVFSALTRHTCSFLQITKPDSIVIYFYDGIRQGMAVTGRKYPFSDGVVVHFWQPSFFGQPLVKHLLPIWDAGKPKFEFLRQGLYALLDGSTQNYHQFTLNFINSGQFIPLRELAADSTASADGKRYQSAEAASFVDYIVYSYGIDSLKQLYSSKDDFAAEVKWILNIDVDSLENRWIDFIETFVGPPDESK